MFWAHAHRAVQGSGGTPSGSDSRAATAVEPPPRTPAGYRDYELTALDRLTFIRAAQAIGLTLGEIRSIIALRDHGQTPCAHVLDLLRQRANELDSRITELRTLRSELRRLVDRADGLDPRRLRPRPGLPPHRPCS